MLIFRLFLAVMTDDFRITATVQILAEYDFDPACFLVLDQLVAHFLRDRQYSIPFRRIDERIGFRMRKLVFTLLDHITLDYMRAKIDVDLPVIEAVDPAEEFVSCRQTAGLLHEVLVECIDPEPAVERRNIPLVTVCDIEEERLIAAAVAGRIVAADRNIATP